MVAKPLCPLYKNIIKPLDRARYPELRYIVGYIFTFMVYGSNKFNRILFGTLSIAFLLFFVYNWWGVSSMPYERFLYIGLGLLVYICEYMYLKAIQNDL